MSRVGLSKLEKDGGVQGEKSGSPGLWASSLPLAMQSRILVGPGRAGHSAQRRPSLSPR